MLIIADAGVEMYIYVTRFSLSFFFWRIIFPRAMWRAANVFNASGRGREGRRDRREIKLETSNISPLGAVAILRAISIRDVVIENERALSSLSRYGGELHFLNPFSFLSFLNDSSHRGRARALKIRAAIIEFLFPRRADYFLPYRAERIDIISRTFNRSVCEKYRNFSDRRTFVKNLAADRRYRENRDRGYQMKKKIIYGDTICITLLDKLLNFPLT